jgi:hypothetical protein
MNKIKHDGSEHSTNYSNTPYWKRLHRDWRVWVGVILILVAMLIYISSEDFAFLPHIQTPLPRNIGK